MSRTIINVHNIKKSFGSTPALQGVSFQVAEGEFFALLGPNGAGKTTLLSILSGLLAAEAGSIECLGEPFDIHAIARRPLLGLAPQDLALYPELTARENLHFFGKLYSVRGKVLAQRAEELLEAVGLADRAEVRVGRFSGGMKRRLNLAVALMHRPRILLLDEPTTGVDPQSRNRIFEEIQAQNRQGLTIIYTSHYMEEVQNLCSKIAIVDHGRLLACAPLEDLMAPYPTEIRLQFKETNAAQSFQELVASTNALWNPHRTDENKIVLHGPNLVPLLPLLQRYQDSLLSLNVLPPTLETVFLQLTGTELRD